MIGNILKPRTLITIVLALGAYYSIGSADIRRIFLPVEQNEKPHVKSMPGQEVVVDDWMKRQMAGQVSEMAESVAVMNGIGRTTISRTMK